MLQQTLVLIKPDGLKKSLTGNILTRLSETKLEIAGAKVVKVSRALAEEHYTYLRNKPFFNELIKYIQGELHERHKVLAMIYHGEDAIQKVRQLAGTTNPEEADPTSIRGSYGRITTSGVYENVIHTSESEKEAEREIKLWFRAGEVIYHIYPVKEVILEKVSEQEWA